MTKEMQRRLVVYCLTAVHHAQIYHYITLVSEAVERWIISDVRFSWHHLMSPYDLHYSYVSGFSAPHTLLCVHDFQFRVHVWVLCACIFVESIAVRRGSMLLFFVLFIILCSMCILVV